MCLIYGVSVNCTLSNRYGQASNLSHHMQRDQKSEKECANPFPAQYRATLRPVGDLDMIGVESIKNLKIFIPAAADCRPASTTLPANRYSSLRPPHARCRLR